MKFTILQWNCMYSENPEKVGAFILEQRPEIVCLQELTLDYHAQHANTGKYLERVLGFHGYYSYGAMVLPDGTQSQTGMGIFSKFPIVNAKKVILQKSLIENGKITSDERFYLQAVIQIGDKKLTVGTTHLPFHPRFQTTVRKQAMVNEILRHVPENRPYILAGDLNTTPGTKAALSFRRGGLRNAGPAFKIPTWTTKPFTIGPWSYEQLQWRLDYILYAGSLRKVSSEVVDTALSDHLPILSMFEFA